MVLVIVKKSILVVLSLFIFGCSTTEQNTSKKLDKEFEERFKVSEFKLSNGYWIVIFTDNKTGREFLAHNHGLVEIRPKEEITK